MSDELYVPDFAVKIHGLVLGADVRNQTLEVSYENCLDSADMFTLRLGDPDLKLADSDLFSTGNTVELHMGYAGRLEPMILGDIAAVQPSLSSSGPNTLTITGYDKSQRMRHNTPSRMTFKGLNDSLMVAAIAAENLLIPMVDPSILPPRFSVQQTGSDWAFLRELADRNAFEVFVRWDKLYFRFPRPQLQRVTLEWGRNLTAFQPRLSTAGQAGIIELRGYDYKLAEAIVTVLPAVALGEDLTATLDRLGQSFLQELIALGRRTIRHQPPGDMLEGLALAKCVLQQLLDGLYEGSGTCVGVPQLRAGDQVEIRGVGKRFSGVYKLRSVTHTIDDRGYQTRFEVSQKDGAGFLSSLRQKLVEAASPKAQEPFLGVLIGIIKNNIDPEGLGRVWVSLPLLSDTNVSNWARLAAQSDGTYFIPDLGTEVLVAFEQGDVNRPYVLGQLWNGQNRAPETNLDGLNRIRKISTPAGHEIRFDDMETLTKLSLKSAAGHEITLDDSLPEATLTIKHSSGSTITLTGGPSPSVTIETKGSLVLKGASVTVQATDPTGTLTLQSSGVKAILDATKMDVS